MGAWRGSWLHQINSSFMVLMLVLLLLLTLLMDCLAWRPTGMKNSAKGKGYTIRIGGRKCLATSILEEQIEAAQKQFE